MSTWFNTEAVAPLADREVIAKNTSREFPADKTSKQHVVVKYNARFDGESIKNVMLDDGLTQWRYADTDVDGDDLINDLVMATESLTLINLLNEIKGNQYDSVSQISGAINNKLDAIQKLRGVSCE